MRICRLHLLLFLLCSLSVHKASTQDLTNRILSFPEEHFNDSLKKEIKRQYGKNDSLIITGLHRTITQLKSKNQNNVLGYLYMTLSNAQNRQKQFSKAQLSLDSAISCFRVSRNLKGECLSLIYKANTYRETLRGNQALDILFNALKRLPGDPYFEFLLRNEIGEIFKDMKNYKEAYKYFLSGEKAYAQLQKPDEIADESVINMYKNLGVLYRNDRKFDKALDYFNKALRKAEAMGNEKRTGSVYNSVGLFYKETGNYPKAIEYLKKSLAVKIRIGDSLPAANTLNNMGSIYLSQKRYDSAEALFKRAYRIFNSLPHDSTRYFNTLEGLAELSWLRNRGQQAYEYLKQAYDIRSKVYQSNVSSDAARLEAIFENEKHAREIEISNVKNAELNKNLELKQQQQTILIIGLSIMALLLLWALWSYTGKRKANRLLKERNTEMARQKLLLEQQHKEIVDSINYAKKIQSAILPSAEEFKKILGNCFVFFRPKDIVSGDFYWVAEKEDFIFYATVDCTGHGVPGGFMSVLAASLLNEIVNENNLTRPDEIMNVLRTRVITALKQKGEWGENKDGMDMVLCRIHKKNRELALAAANNPVWVLRQNGFLEIKPDKFPVGISPYENTPFTLHNLQLQPNDTVYTFTDGYADQFGGPKGKKFKYANLQKLLLDIQQLSANEQLNTIHQAFEDWKGGLEQVDDVCVIGIRID